MPKEDEKKRIKIRFTKMHAAIIFVILATVAATYVYASNSSAVFSCDFKDVSLNFGVDYTRCAYRGAVLNFRASLKEAAARVPVKPGVNEVATTIGSAWVENITIVYKASENNDTAKYYNLEAFEIANKLKTIMLADGVDNVGIDAKPLSAYNRTDYAQLPGQIQHPLIAIMPPEFANQTLVYAAPEHVVYISAVSDKDFDLAVAQFIMSVLRIQLQ